MKMKLSSLDVLQIAKALKCGWLDTDRIESFKSLVDGYNPPKEISRKEQQERTKLLSGLPVQRLGL